MAKIKRYNGSSWESVPIEAEKDGEGNVISDKYAKKTDIPTVNNAKLTIKAEGTEKGTFTANSASDVEINIKASDLGLSGAMKFIGSTSTGIYDGSTMQSIMVGVSTVTAETGSVVLKGDKEFVWTGSKWEELGDEASHALKSIKITATGALSGGGSLEADREITHNSVTRTDSSTLSAAPGFGGTFKAIGSVTSDSYGHITAVDERTVTIPSTAATQSAAGLMSADDKKKLDGIESGANNMAYALSSSDATITLTPSSGSAQSVTVDNVASAGYATKALQDASGNVISSTYVKTTSSQLLTGWTRNFSEVLNQETSPNGIPLLGSKQAGTNAITGLPYYTYGLVFLSISSTKQTVAANSVSSTASRTYAVQKDSDGNLVVNVPWANTVYTLPTATASTLGGIKTTFTTSGSYGLTFTNANYGISLKGYYGGIQFTNANYRITDIETGTISLGSQAFTAGSSVAKNVTFHNTSYVNSSGTVTSGAKVGSLRVFLQFVGYNGEDMTCGLISLTDTGFSAYVKCTQTLSASSTRYIHWMKVREY